MNKKKLMAGLLIGASVGGFCLSGATAQAAEVDKANTEVGIGFFESGHGPGENPGPLELKWAPLRFDFGTSNKVNTATESFDVKNGDTKYVVVSDKRQPITAGDKWQVTAKLGKLTSTSTAEELAGAKLSFAVDGDTGYQGVNPPEVAGSIVAKPAGATATVTTAAAELEQDGTAIEIFKDGDGVNGTYKGFSAVELSNIKLEVPGNAAKQDHQYEGTLTWSLDDTL